MNERMKILELLEEGKINAEEAAKLLEALGESGRKRKFSWQGFEFFPDIIGSIFERSLKDIARKEYIELNAKKKIKLKGISGDVEINGSDIENIVIEKDGFAKIEEENDELIIKAISGNLKIATPRIIDIETKGISGDLSMNNINGKIVISSVSGDIIGKGLAGMFEGDFLSGDVELEYDDIEGLKIKSRRGDIYLELSESIEAEIEVSTIQGDIECELPLQNLIRRSNYLKGILNGPKAKIEIKSNFGDVILRKKSELTRDRQQN